ncbi:MULTISPECIES: hypothetical protein [unclassified Streptomyces]|uniref:hypothetical protein n=1 Tax=unclassified Streptomyces TaxID=2593676 RepID=UPI0033DAD6B3
MASEQDLFWEDKEVIESRRVGDTEYTRAYTHGVEEDTVWATRGTGEIEDVGSAHGVSASHIYRSLTHPDAPTKLSDQRRYEAELQAVLRADDDPAVQIDHLLQELPDYLADARQELKDGTITQAEYDSRVTELENTRQQLERDLRAYQGSPADTGQDAQPSADAVAAARLAQLSFPADAGQATAPPSSPTTARPPVEPERTPHAFER